MSRKRRFGSMLRTMGRYNRHLSRPQSEPRLWRVQIISSPQEQAASDRENRAYIAAWEANAGRKYPVLYVQILGDDRSPVNATAERP